MSNVAIRFNGARLKRLRGVQHLETVAQMVAEYEEGGPFALDAEEEGEVMIYRVRFLKVPALMIGAVIGDFLHNMRSSLDIAACCIVEFFNPVADLSKVQFPIDGSCGSMRAADRSRLLGNAKAIAIIESVRSRHAHALAALQLLSNQDKHRLITTAAVRAQAARVELDQASQTARIICSPDVEPDLWRTPLVSGDVVARGKLPGAGLTFRLALLVGEEALEITVLNSINTAVGEALFFLEHGKWPSSDFENVAP